MEIADCIHVCCFDLVRACGPKEDAQQVVAKWSKAFAGGNKNAIVELYAPEALMIGTAGKAVLTKPEQIRAHFEGAFKAFDKPRTATIDSSEALTINESSVVITGFDTITGGKDGQPITSKGRVTFVVAKRGPDWVIAHLHRSPLPQT